MAGMIHVSHLTKNYPNHRAIDDLTFDIRKGEIVGLLGPNGAGKTTTMRILTTYLPPTSGEVQIGGYDIFDHSLEIRRIIGYLPETVALYPEMTVTEYLLFMANLRRIKNADLRVRQMIELVKLEERSKGYIGKLSKGMIQRLGLAQALLHEPEVLILDEPTIGLDPAQIIEVRNLIREIGRDHTVLLSTHILSEAQQVCDRIMIINKGKIVAEDTREGLQNRLMGAKRVLLRVRGEADDIIPLISNIPGIIKVTPKGEETLEIDTNSEDETCPQIARAIVNAGYDLLRLQTTGLSLEEIFIQLTRDEPQSPSFREDLEHTGR